MTDLSMDTLTQAVKARFDNTPDPRLQQVMSSLVEHLHAFAKDVQLTQDEWIKAIEFLTATGQTCTDKRQEFILLSDVLGLSMLTVMLASNKPSGCTQDTVFGPFYVEGAPAYVNGDDIANGAAGSPCLVSGTVNSVDGQVIAGAKVEVWQADDEGEYDVQKSGLDGAQGRGSVVSRTDGSFHFKTVTPSPYPIPTDGPVGQLLESSKRSAWRPAHLHFMITAPGYEPLITHVFRVGDEYLQSDPVFGVRDALVVDWPIDENGVTNLSFDFVLNAERSYTAQGVGA